MQSTLPFALVGLGTVCSILLANHAFGIFALPTPIHPRGMPKLKF